MASVGKHAPQTSVAFIGVILQHDKLIGHQVVSLQFAAFDGAEDQTFQLLNAQLTLLIELINGGAGATQHGVAAVEPISVNAVGLKILAWNIKRITLHASVDVLGDENCPQTTGVQPMRHAKNFIVGHIKVQRERCF